MNLDRLTSILDSYGADPERWPTAERAAALALLTRSADARRHLDAAAHLDQVLDTLPSAPPASSALRARIIAAAPARRRSRRAPLLAAPLAAAAVIALWMSRTPPPNLQPATNVPMARLGVYETPTDSLLTLDELDVAADPSPSYESPDGRDGPRLAPDDDPLLTSDMERMHA